MRNVHCWRALALGCIDSVFFDAATLRAALQRTLASRPNSPRTQSLIGCFEHAQACAKLFSLALPTQRLETLLLRCKAATRTDQRITLFAAHALAPETKAQVIQLAAPELRFVLATMPPHKLNWLVARFLRTFGFAVESEGRLQPMALRLKETATNIKSASVEFDRICAILKQPVNNSAE